ncbi:hypothetical protein BCR43DRAFT_487883 [Syncephalastrum racemosum]|uniref:Uncharacterized protein n=1 Tax=Syncephalastrum racemosum TaxID=13706 RepID=A0A1X2HHS5_SYNRA|nr:hypothetical protein BCR43DRAFT_487883 [Syncephalastrum racemosum]
MTAWAPVSCGWPAATAEVGRVLLFAVAAVAVVVSATALAWHANLRIGGLKKCLGIDSQMTWARAQLDCFLC